MKTLIILLGLIIFSISSVHATGKSGMEKYRNYTPQQVADMPNEERRSEMPMFYTQAARNGIYAEAKFFFGMALNRLMYPGLSDYQTAVIDFQKDLGEKPTGEWTVWQIYQLTKRSKAQNHVRVHFPDQFFSSKHDDYALVKGTVKILDDNIYWPVNHHKIVCQKKTGVCEVNQIMLSLPKPDSESSTIYQVLEDSPIEYKITRWEENTIEAQYVKSPLDATNCRTTSLSLNFKLKEFYFITKNEGGDCEVLGTKLEKLSKPRISQVVDGKDIIKSEFAKITKTAYSYYSSKFRNKLNKILKEEKARQKTGKK